MTLAALDVPGIEEARQRLPERASDVPQEARDALEPPEGPLAGESDHATGEEILKPSAEAEDTLATVVEHHTVADIEDVADELGTSAEIAERALTLHDIEVSEPEGEDTPESSIEVPLAGKVDTDHLADPVWSDHRLAEHLAVRCQYGVAEIKTFLERERNRGRSGDKPRWTVRTEDIKRALRECGIMPREDPEARTAESEDLRLPKSGIEMRDKESPGGTVNYEKVREDPNITVQPGGE